MSIISEITRIRGNVTAAKAAIREKGVVVPDESKSDDLASLILQIPVSEKEAFVVHGSASGSTGLADATYAQIVAAIGSGSSTLGALILGEYTFGSLPVFLTLIVEGRMCLGALSELDTVNQKAYFIVAGITGNSLSINSSGTITIESR